jgi:hypothetical protein
LSWPKDKTGGDKGFLPNKLHLIFYSRTKTISAMIGFVEIANATYFIDTITGFYRDDAKTKCESLSMAVISFEGDEQKWRAVTNWLNDNGTSLPKSLNHFTFYLINYICV